MAILVLTYWSYKDALIQTYTLPYLKQISIISKKKIYLICMEKHDLVTTTEERRQINSHLGGTHNIKVIFLDYNRFGIKQVVKLTGYIFKLLYLVLSKNVSQIHCWCTPAGALGYFLHLITRRQLIIDSYEPHAEAMVENGAWQKKSFAFKLLFWLEKKQSQKASFFIAAASGMKDYAARKYQVQIKPQTFFVKPACTDLTLFNPNSNRALLTSLGLEDKVVCVYAGKLGGIYLDHEVFDFFKVCLQHWGDKFIVVMLTNASPQVLDEQLKRVQFAKENFISLFAPHADIPKYLSVADFALTPVKSVPTKKYCTPIKDGEYWAMGLPVVITKNISDDSDIITAHNAGYVLKELNRDEYVNAVNKISEILTEPYPQRRGRIRAIAEKYRNFEIAEQVYRQIYM